MRVDRSFWMLALLWAAVIFALSSIPARALPSVPGLGYDKLAHVTVYAVLGGVSFLAARNTWSAHPAWLMLGCTLAAVLYGLTDEFHQTFVPGRAADAWDVLADGVGGLVGSLSAAAWSRRPQRPGERARRSIG